MVRKVNGKWQMANGIKKLYAIRYTLYAKKGFTLVELLIVIGIISLLLGFSLPAYNSYNTSQRMKQSSENMLQTMRRAQNSAVAGVFAPNCSSGYNFDGWYIHLHQNNNHVEHASASCSRFTPSYLQEDVGVRNYLRFLGDNISVSQVRVLDSAGNPIAFDPVTDGVYVLFRPAGKALEVYRQKNFTPTYLLANANAVEITISDGSKTAKTRITAAGAINNI